MPTMKNLCLLRLLLLVPITSAFNNRGQDSLQPEDHVYTPSFPAANVTSPSTSGVESPRGKGTCDRNVTSCAVTILSTVAVEPVPSVAPPTSSVANDTSKLTSEANTLSTFLVVEPQPSVDPPTMMTKTTKKASSTSPYTSTVPDIDTCGAGSGANVSCPGAGANGYYYRCCSGAGHCGPKNSLQAQALYCGNGCQAGYSNGKCGGSMSAPPNPTGTPGTAQDGETCGPIVNKRCAAGLCCSGSNYCGTGADFCGKANWCQSQFGMCDS